MSYERAELPQQQMSCIGQGMQENPVREQPCIGWDLTLYPKAVNRAYWDESADRLLQSDRQVGAGLQASVLGVVAV